MLKHYTEHIACGPDGQVLIGKSFMHKQLGVMGLAAEWQIARSLVTTHCIG
ncbi:hypothetical protein OAR53_02330 [Luminiphilus sp.]|nr:hypothetical protein [Luminiphilus sp.]MDC0973150.1 hypothetical protein [Luminiphilus sp.]